jgi:hypothetical protein
MNAYKADSETVTTVTHPEWRHPEASDGHAAGIPIYAV